MTSYSGVSLCLIQQFDGLCCQLSVIFSVNFISQNEVVNAVSNTSPPQAGIKSNGSFVFQKRETERERCGVIVLIF